MLRASHALSATMLALLAAVAAPAHAIPTVSGVATNLTDVTPGQDLWRYDFTLGGTTATGDLLSIALSTSFFNNVSVVSPAQAGWSASVVQGLSQTFDIKDTGVGSATPTFSLNLVRSGLPPASLSWVFTSAAGSTFGSAAITTSAPVPEPATYGLMAMGLVAMGLRRRSRKD